MVLTLQIWNNAMNIINNNTGIIDHTKSVLGRVRNCVGEQALHYDMVASSYVCQPNHSYIYAESMFRFHSDHTRGYVVAGVPHSVWLELPHQGTTLQYYSQACGDIVFTKSCTCTAFVWYLLYTCCDATITLHKRNTNIQELCTLPNTLLLTIIP